MPFLKIQNSAKTKGASHIFLKATTVNRRLTNTPLRRKLGLVPTVFSSIPYIETLHKANTSVKATFYLTIFMRGERATGKIQRNNCHHGSCGTSLTSKPSSVSLIFTQGTHRNVKNRWVKSSLKTDNGHISMKDKNLYKTDSSDKFQLTCFPIAKISQKYLIKRKYNRTQ